MCILHTKRARRHTLGQKRHPQLCSAISLICCSLTKVPGLGKSEAEHMAIPELENEPLGNCSRWKNLHKASRCPYNQKSLKDFCLLCSCLWTAWAQMGCSPCPTHCETWQWSHLPSEQEPEGIFLKSKKLFICLSIYVSLKEQGAI